MENYSLYQAKHLNMDSLYQLVTPAFAVAQTTTDYGLIVQEYISTLQYARHYLQEVHSQWRMLAC